MELYHGDAVEVMASMEEDSVDSIVTDPPYFLRFMGKKWDRSPSPKEMQAQHETWAIEAFRVLKPGGHMLAFGGTRTVHRLTCAIEDAGFEIRDTIQWIYGSGFPKSANVGKNLGKLYSKKRRAHGLIPTDGTETMQRYMGHGTALKPAHEPIVLARKPLSESSVARQVLATGTGALNIDGSRVGTEPRHNGAASTNRVQTMGRPDHSGSGWNADYSGNKVQGRWPANLLLSHVPPDENGNGGCEATGGVRRVKGERIGSRGAGGQNGKYSPIGAGAGHDYTDPDGTEEVAEYRCAKDEQGNYICPIAIMDEQSGQLAKTGRASTNSGPGGYGAAYGGARDANGYADKGGASRFFQQFTPDTHPGFLYQAKASRRERNAGLENSQPKLRLREVFSQADVPEHLREYFEEVVSDGVAVANSHPT